MRPDRPGIVLDSAALSAARTNLYIRTLIRTRAELGRPIVVPATALVTAVATGRIRAPELDPPAFTVTALNQAVAPAVAMIIATASDVISIDAAHAVYEATSTGFPLVTTDASAYHGLAVTVDIDEVP